MIHELPRQRCQSSYCTNIGRYWHGQLIAMRRPPAMVVGWCDLCRRFVCRDCALHVELLPQELEQLPNIAALTEKLRRRQTELRRLLCPRCGSILQKAAHVPALIVGDEDQAI